MVEQKSALNVVLGTMTFGEPGAEGTRISDLNEIEKIFDIFQGHGHSEVDTAFFYSALTSEKVLGKTDWKARGLKMETKLFPSFIMPVLLPGVPRVSHTPEDVKKYIDIQLKNLGTDSLEIFYLHGPDRATPFKDTLGAINELYKEGKFKRFGISNYMAWEVAEIVSICRQYGWVLPTVYQGPYNPIQRIVEPELFPCLRKFGISFYCFSPLGGGFFTGRYNSMDDQPESGSRFDSNKELGGAYRSWYWKEPYFKALALLRPICESHGFTLPEVALRWLSHHSLMKREYGDAILLGASSLKHAAQNLDDLDKGPLPDDVVKALDEAAEITKAFAAVYWY